ncbi:MAG: tetratricopeptide repeat protein [Bryobacteraceae bacterium]
MHANKHDFTKGVALHRSGRLRDAERVYRNILALDPDHADCLHLLGLIASEAGQPPVAAVLIGRAIQVSGPLAMYCSNLGLVFSRMDKAAEAIACYRQALKADPADNVTYGRLGRLLLHRKSFEEAREALQKSIAIQPQADVLCDLGTVLFALKQFDDAGAAYERAIQGQPDNPEALYNLGVIRTIQNRTADAMQAYRAALALLPEYPDAHNNLGILLQSAGQLELALDEYRLALACNPDSAEARYNRGFLLQESDRLDEAHDEYRELLRRRPAHFEAHNNLGNTFLALGEPEHATAEYEAALVLNPDHAEAHWNRGIAQLTLGNLPEGWRDYEWRFRQPRATPRIFNAPVWDGGPIAGKRILLHAEQGLGDTMQFVRYAAMVKALDSFVILECQRPLLGLLRRMAGPVKLIDELVAAGSEFRGMDYQAPLLSLPRLFGTTLGSIPWPGPYLRADPRLIEKWARAIRDVTRSDQLKVGLCWAGNPQHRNDRNRSVPVAEFAALAGLPQVAFFSLQKDAETQPELPFLPLPEPLTSFDDTAALIANLDLVISADTSVAHLAGGMGKPVWILLPFAADWRWLMERTDSPWYPSARLFRQTRRKDWAGVLGQVRQELVSASARETDGAGQRDRWVLEQLG